MNKATIEISNHIKKDSRVHISLKDMKALNIGASEPILINERIVFSAWPSTLVSPGNLQISQISSENLDLHAGSDISIAKLDKIVFEAEKVVIDASDQDIDPENRTLLHLIKNELLELKYLINGQLFWLNLGDQRFQLRAKVHPSKSTHYVPAPGQKNSETEYASSFVFTMRTEVQFNREIRKSKDNLGFRSIGGLSKQISVVRDMVELPLKNPEIFDKFGIYPPKGILLYGPPGTGKTLIARAVSNELGAKVFVINGAEIFSRYIGETESRLLEIFEEASKSSPSIVFIDEIDALCSKRDESTSETEKRIVASLLTLMDGIDRKKKVFVIGATNRPNALDPALRRPGRLDKEIEIGIPDADSRRDILKVILDNMPHRLSEHEMDMIAGSTHGYVGADLAGLCREAGIIAMQRSITKGYESNNLSPVDIKDFLRAKSSIRPSAMREISLEIPKVHWSDIGGLEDVKKKLQESIEWPLQNPEAFEILGISPPKGVLLYGPPGCSKTLMAKAIATESGLNFFAIKGPEIFNKWVGESERAIKEIFRKARAASPSIVFFDEIDAIASKRGGIDGFSSSSTSVGDRVLTQLLTELDGVESLVNVTIVAATNRPDIIDPALIRPGRLDRLIYIPPPDLDARKKILQINFQKMPVSPDVSIDFIAKKTDGMSGAEIVALCQESALMALHSSKENAQVDKSMTISLGCFESALRRIKPRISKELLQYYQRFANCS